MVNKSINKSRNKVVDIFAFSMLFVLDICYVVG